MYFLKIDSYSAILRSSFAWLHDCIKWNFVLQKSLETNLVNMVQRIFSEYWDGFQIWQICSFWDLLSDRVDTQQRRCLLNGPVGGSISQGQQGCAGPCSLFFSWFLGFSASRQGCSEQISVKVWNAKTLPGVLLKMAAWIGVLLATRESRRFVNWG